MAILITALLIIGYAGWALTRGGRRGPAGPTVSKARNACVWNKTGNRSGAFVEYHCATCGVDAYSRTDAAPKDCKKGLL